MDSGPNSKGKSYLVGQSPECLQCPLIRSGISNLVEFHRREEERQSLRTLSFD